MYAPERAERQRYVRLGTPETGYGPKWGTSFHGARAVEPISETAITSRCARYRIGAAAEVAIATQEPLTQGGGERAVDAPPQCRLDHPGLDSDACDRLDHERAEAVREPDLCDRLLKVAAWRQSCNLSALSNEIPLSQLKRRPRCRGLILPASSRYQRFMVCLGKRPIVDRISGREGR